MSTLTMLPRFIATLHTYRTVRMSIIITVRLSINAAAALDGSMSGSGSVSTTPVPRSISMFTSGSRSAAGGSPGGSAAGSPPSRSATSSGSSGSAAGGGSPGGSAAGGGSPGGSATGGGSPGGSAAGGPSGYAIGAQSDHALVVTFLSISIYSRAFCGYVKGTVVDRGSLSQTFAPQIERLTCSSAGDRLFTTYYFTTTILN